MVTRLPWILGATLPLLGLLIAAPQAAATAALSGIPAALVFIAGLGYGSLLLRFLPLTCPWQQGVVAAAIGTGLLGHASLVLALAGLLNQGTAATLIAAGLAAGLSFVKQRQPPKEPKATHHSGPMQVADLLPAIALAWPIGVLLFAAALPPGTFWQGEARGYDVLEYHLQGPREWFLAGQMQFLPHNVYTVFPQQAEVLYLLLMHLVGDCDTAAVPSQLLHALFTIAAVVAAAAFAPPGWPRRAVLIAIGTVPWLVVVGSLAYVEGALLFFAVVASGLLLHAKAPATSMLIAAGACAGLAGGCKYTALALVAAALPLAWLIAGPGRLSARARGVLLFGVVAAVVFSPWAIRNAVWTANPVYPFAYQLFGGEGWSPLQDEQWSRGHRVAHTVGQRLELASRELFGRRTSAGWQGAAFGAIFVVGALAVLMIRTRRGLVWLVWLVLILLTWGAVTHMPGRFAIVALAPLAGLIAETFAGPARFVALLRPAPLLRLIVLGATMGAGWAVSGHLLAESAGFWQQREVDPAALAGRPEEFRAAHPLNQLPEDARIWLIGDAAVFYIDRPVHYTVVFSRDPWLAAAQAVPDQPAAQLDWLRSRGWTHVAVRWPEVERLRATYGFPEAVRPGWFRELEQAGGLVPVLPEALRAGYAVWELSDPAMGAGLEMTGSLATLPPPAP